jgi:hypothetical protein
MAKHTSKGVLLKLSIGGTFTTIGHRTSFSDPDEKKEFWDATDLDSGEIKESHTPTGHLEPGTINVEFWYDPSDGGQSALQAAKSEYNDPSDFLITNPAGGADRLFSGWVQSFGVEYKTGSGQVGKATIALTTKVTYD